MKIIVMGASGQIGSVIYQGLRHLHDVVGTSRNKGAPYLRFDPFRDDWSALSQADVLINCIGQIYATRASSLEHIHVGVTRQIINHRALLGNPRIIQISALGAAADHRIEFLRTKGIADDLLLQVPNTTVVRPSIVCTHGTMIVKKMQVLFRVAKLTAGRLFVPEGFLSTTIQPVMPDDLVDAVQALCTEPAPPKVLNVVGETRLTFGKLIAMMSQVSRRKLRTIEISRNFADRLVMNGLGRLLPHVITPQQYQLLFDDNVADASEVEKIIGRRVSSSEPFFINEFQHAED